MRPDLLQARDRAFDRHSDALARHPGKSGEDFRLAIAAVVADLQRTIAAASDGSADRIELAKAHRYLGDAFYDYGLCGTKFEAWCRGADAYRTAEQLLAEVASPVEQAKLDFNFGNTLAGLSDGTDVGLLAAAGERYQRAAVAFRAHMLPTYADMVERRLATLSMQLRAARAATGMAKHVTHLQGLAQSIDGADGVARNRIAAELKRSAEALLANPTAALLTGALKAVTAEVREHAQTDPAVAGQLTEVEQIIAALPAARPSPDGPPAAAEPDASAIMLQMFVSGIGTRLAADKAARIVSPDRAAEIAQLMGRAQAIMADSSDDLASQQRRTLALNELKKKAARLALNPSTAVSPPPAGSPGGRSMAILDGLARYLLAEKTQSMQPSGEAARGTELYGEVAKLAAAVREAAGDADRLRALDERVWSTAADVHEFARRYHLTVAHPIFPLLTVAVSARSLFVAAGNVLRAAAAALANSDGLELHVAARRADVAQERFTQLQASSVAVFDIAPATADDITPAARAAIHYELGLALALGKACVIVSRAGVVASFDIELQPIVFGDDPSVNVDRLRQGILDALSTPAWGGRHADSGAVGETAQATLAAMLGDRRSTGTLSVQWRLAEAQRGDAIALRGAIEQIVGDIGAGGPAVLLPAWPCGRRDSSPMPMCFHVMPFGRPWSDGARDAVAAACRQRGWTYVRGDASHNQRIVPGIWQDIWRADAVVIDTTDLNANVALELGLVHALGRQHMIVAQTNGDSGSLFPSTAHIFPTIGKFRIHGYRPAPGFAGLASGVEDFLSAIVRSN